MKKKNHWLIGLTLTCLIIWSYWLNPPWIHRLELLVQTLHFHLRGPVAPGPEVVIAAIDEKSIDELGRWPWPRKTMARLVDKLVERQAKVIAFDVVFSSPDESSGIESLKNLQKEVKIVTQNDFVHETIDRYIRKSDSDTHFAEALKRSERSVLGYFFHFNPLGLFHLTEEEKHRYFENIKPSQFKGFIKSKSDINLSTMNFRSAQIVESNIQILSQSTPMAGFVSMDVEPDGSIRKLPLIVRYHDRVSKQDYFFPPLSIRVLEKYLEATLLFKVGEFGIEKVLLNSEEPIEIPTNDQGELQINYLGKQRTFPQISIADILNENGNFIPDGALKGKIVLIGATASGLEDVKVTPFDPVFPGVEIHATVIDNILRQNFLHQPKWTLLGETGYLLFWGIVLTFVYSRIRPVFGILAGLAVMVLQLAFTHWIMEKYHLWITDVFPLLENVIIFASLMMYRYNTEEKQKQSIENMFSKYLSSTVIDQLMKDPNNLELGGEKKELTAFFSDIAGFTSLSEKLPPDEQVNLLNAYLTEMTEILFKYEGTLDKYDGDSIKAFFGAPLFFEDHSKRACWVCIEMQEKLLELRTVWQREGKPGLFMRIGINTGEMVVGNIGSKDRMNYGMSGDSVNLAARLEGANKQYSTMAIISESTYEQAKEFIEVRELDSIRVVGRNLPVKIYELLGKKGEINSKIRAILPAYNTGLYHYKMKEWEAAEACFNKVIQRRPLDGPSSALLERCKYFRDHPPEKNWDGVYTFSYK